jgi:aliphatic nitrilase
MTIQVKTKYKVAVVQAAPEFLDLEKGIVKAIKLIDEAADAGASLIAFPEVWLPGYPWWIWLDSPAWGMQFVRRYFENALVIGSEQFERICAQPLAGRSTWSSALPNEMAVRCIWRRQSLTMQARSYRHVASSSQPMSSARSTVKVTVATSQCTTVPWAVSVLCAVPNTSSRCRSTRCIRSTSRFTLLRGRASVYKGAAFQLSAAANNGASQLYAVEGGCFVLAPCATVSKEMLEMLIDNPAKAPLLQEGGGFAMIYGPDGAPLVNPFLKPKRSALCRC